MKCPLLAVAVLLAAAATADAYEADDLAKLLRDNECDWCDLSGADLRDRNLRGVDLFEVNLTGANLIGAELVGVTWTNVDLSEADLTGADLSRTNLFGTNLSGTDFQGADLNNVVYEPALEGLPSLKFLRFADNLHTIKYELHPDGLFKLRAALKETGRRDLERKITYAIKRSERMLAGPVESLFSYVLFEITSDYGMSPGRPLYILICLMGVFAPFYLAPILGTTTGGIYRVWSKERIERVGADDPERLEASGLTALWYAFYFSLLSAVNIGWRDLNVGNWIARIQPREYALHATGWVRTVSGVQSLLSVYLIALWALTYFGRPFE